MNLQDHEGITALHWACSTGSLDVVQLLINAGADPNLMEIDGGRLTPLDYAIIGGHEDVAQFLIESGAMSISGIQELAAVVIQRWVRGFIVRRRYAGVLSGLKGAKVVATEPQVDSQETVPSSLTPSLQDVRGSDSGLDRRRYIIICTCTVNFSTFAISLFPEIVVNCV